MRALVLAAGIGSRLRPLTNHTPKPLIEVGGEPILSRILRQLSLWGIQEAIVNGHYLYPQMLAFVERWNQSGRTPRLEMQDEERLLLDSGGALVQAAPRLFQNQKTALVVNGDVFCNLPYADFVKFHETAAANGGGCTLALIPHPQAGIAYGGVRVEHKLVTAFLEKDPKLNQPPAHCFHFPGFYLIEKTALELLNLSFGPRPVKQDIWLPLIRNRKLGAFVFDGHYLDLGSPAELKEAESYLQLHPKFPL
jgi:NDP-sugar pyrophosphorylase family protein